MGCVKNWSLTSLVPKVVKLFWRDSKIDALSLARSLTGWLAYSRHHSKRLMIVDQDFENPLAQWIVQCCPARGLL